MNQSLRNETLEQAQDMLLTLDVNIETHMTDDNGQPLGLTITPQQASIIPTGCPYINTLTRKFEVVVINKCFREVDEILTLSPFEQQDVWHEDIGFDGDDVNYGQGEYSITSIAKNAVDYRLQDTFYGVKNEVLRAMYDFLYINDRNMATQVHENGYDFSFHNVKLKQNLQEKYFDFMAKTYQSIPQGKKMRISWKSDGDWKSVFHLNKLGGKIVHGRPSLIQHDGEYGYLSSSSTTYQHT